MEGGSQVSPPPVVRDRKWRNRTHARARAPTSWPLGGEKSAPTPGETLARGQPPAAEVAPHHS
eukprot:6215701-Alexandrium_andersonii.AAC.1